MIPCRQNPDDVACLSVHGPFMNLILLAGGRSKRMGYCKYTASLAGIPLYAYPLRRLRSACRRQFIVENIGTIPQEHVPESLVVHDLVQEGGPLAGIHAGLAVSDSWLNFVTAADMPFPCPSLVTAMGTYAAERGMDIVYPDMDGLLEPLFAVYSRRAAAVALELLRTGHRSIRELFHDPRLNTDAIDRRFVSRYDDQLLSFFNVNTPEDLIVAELMMRTGEKSLQEECA